jgi:hypothetical protein
MPTKRDLALKIIKYLLDNPSFYFPFLVMCKGYPSYANNDEEFVEIIPKALNLFTCKPSHHTPIPHSEVFWRWLLR